MRPYALVLTLCFAFAGAARAQEAGLLPFASAFKTATDSIRAAQQVRRYTFEWGGLRGNRWTLQPDMTPPGSSITIWVDQGDRVELTFVKYSNPRSDGETSVDIDDLDAVVDGQPARGVHLWLRSLGHEEHTVSFDAKAEGMILLYSRWGNRAGRWATIVVRKKK